MSTVHLLPKFLLIDNFNLNIINSFENIQHKMWYKDFKYFLRYIYNVYYRISKISENIKLLFGSRFLTSAAVHQVEILYILSELSAGFCVLLCCRLHLLLVEKLVLKRKKISSYISRYRNRKTQNDLASCLLKLGIMTNSCLLPLYQAGITKNGPDTDLEAESKR